MESNPSPLLYLCQDIWNEINSYLSTLDLITLAHTNQTLRQKYIFDHRLWTSTMKSQFHHTYQKNSPLTPYETIIHIIRTRLCGACHRYSMLLKTNALFKINLCPYCLRSGLYDTCSAVQAKIQFGLTDQDILPLRCIMHPNPHRILYPNAASMRLFARSDLTRVSQNKMNTLGLTLTQYKERRKHRGRKISEGLIKRRKKLPT
jgi:hypothetical protein